MLGGPSILYVGILYVLLSVPRRRREQESANESKRAQTQVCKRAQKIRAARLQNETAPEKNLIWHERQFEKREKRTRKTIRNETEFFKAPLRPPKNCSPALFNKF